MMFHLSNLQLFAAIIGSLCTLLSLFLTDVVWIESLCCILFICCVLAKKKNEGISLYMIFLFMMYFFCVNVIFSDLLGGYDIKQYSMYGEEFFFSSKVLIESLRSINIFLNSVMIGWLISSKKRIISVKQKKYRINDNTKPTLLFVLYILFIFAVAKSFILVYSAVKYGYVESVHLGNRIEANRIIDLGASMFRIYGLLCLYLADTKNEFKKIAIIYSIPTVLTILTGQRGPAMVMLLVMIWIYDSHFQHLKMRRWVVVAFIGLVVVAFIGIYRSDSSDSSLFSVGMQMLLNQGVGFRVVNMTIFLSNDFTNKVPFLLGYLTDLFVDVEPYVDSTITAKNYLAYHISYLAFPMAYYTGHTIGTSLIAEIYELVHGNYLFIYIISLSLVFTCRIMISNLYKNPIWFVLGFQYVSYFLYSPRDSVGKMLSIALIYEIIFMVLFIVYVKNSRRKA